MTLRRWFVHRGLCLCVAINACTGSPERPRESGATQAGAPSEAAVEFVNSLGMRMILVPSASFNMGPANDESDVAEGGVPVRLSAFYIASTEVTKEHYRTFLKANRDLAGPAELAEVSAAEEAFIWPDIRNDLLAKYRSLSRAPSEHHPVFTVSWPAARRFCAWLSEREGREYRLPTEAQWEYAVGCGERTRYWWGTERQFSAMSVGIPGGITRTDIPGTHAANPFGLFGAYGNACEWTENWHSTDEVGVGGALVDPKGPPSGTRRVLRGGAVFSRPSSCNTRKVFGVEPDRPVGGIRLVCSVKSVVEAGTKPSLRGTPKHAASADLPGLATFEVLLGKGVPLELVSIPAGRFLQGTVGVAWDKRQTGYAHPDEGPPFEVAFPQALWMSRSEITQAQYAAVLQSNPSVYDGDDLPVHNVPLSLARRFCAQLTLQHRRAGLLGRDEVYRLPTESEWEYACRAGSTTRYSFGDDPELLASYGWVDQLGGPVAVRSLHPNAFGLYDMHGNVWEWTDTPWAWYPKPGSRNTYDFIARGGGWNFMAHRARSAARYSLRSDQAYQFCGFRIVRAAVTE